MGKSVEGEVERWMRCQPVPCNQIGAAVNPDIYLVERGPQARSKCEIMRVTRLETEGLPVSTTTLATSR